MATMSRQHYTRLADTLGRAVAVEAVADSGGEGIRAAGAAYRVALAVADSLADTSPRYDGGRFLDAVAVAASRTRATLAASGGGTYGAGRAIDEALSQRRTASRY
jgi:hypothetical protein